MNKLVYLFELDSVRKNQDEIVAGQRAIFSEILKNGNRVALSLNQLVDSRAFIELIADENIFHYVLSLFKMGALRVSLYGGMTTASRYMQNSLDKCNDANDNFQFTSLPIKKGETEKIEMLKSALQNSDLSGIKQHIKKLESEQDSNREDDAKNMEIRDYEHLLNYIELILKISMNETSNIPKKTQDKRNFLCFMQTIKKVLFDIKVESAVWNNNVIAVLDVLSNIETDIETKNLEIEEYNRKNSDTPGYNAMRKTDILNRSNWLDRVFCDEDTDLDFVVRMLINLCYNYTIEDSIADVTKHYDESDFEGSFSADLQKRIQDCLNGYENKEACPVLKSPGVREWKRLERIADIRNDETYEVDNYEKTYDTDKLKWRLAIVMNCLKSLFLILFYIGLFFVVEMTLSALENSLMPLLQTVMFAGHITDFITVLLFGLLSSLISKKLPDILECFVSIGLWVGDAVMVFGGKYDSYRQY